MLTIQPSGSGLFNPHLPAPYPSPFSRDRNQEPSKLWPLSIQITLTGRIASHQLPADMTLVDALRTLQTQDEGATSASSQVYGAVVRIPEGLGPAGTSKGVSFTLRIGVDGLEVWNAE